jgi:hypothetical protein
MGNGDEQRHGDLLDYYSEKTISELKTELLEKGASLLEADGFIRDVIEFAVWESQHTTIN